MALTTQHDLPYPDPTDDVRLGAAAIRALAEALDERLGGAMFRVGVDNEPVASGVDDRLELTFTVGDSPYFTNPAGQPNRIKYVGPVTVVAMLYAYVAWEGNGAGTRRMWIDQNDTEVIVDRRTPDAEAISTSLAWPVLLAPGDTLSLVVRQTSGGSLNASKCRFRCVVLGIKPE